MRELSEDEVKRVEGKRVSLHARITLFMVLWCGIAVHLST